jgi:hypothetical protein
MTCPTCGTDTRVIATRDEAREALAVAVYALDVKK